MYFCLHIIDEDIPTYYACQCDMLIWIHIYPQIVQNIQRFKVHLSPHRSLPRRWSLDDSSGQGLLWQGNGEVYSRLCLVSSGIFARQGYHFSRSETWKSHAFQHRIRQIGMTKVKRWQSYLDICAHLIQIGVNKYFLQVDFGFSKIIPSGQRAWYRILL
jgi:hypothetical protein